MNKKKYEPAEIEVIKYNTEDVMTASEGAVTPTEAPKYGDNETNLH